MAPMTWSRNAPSGYPRKRHRRRGQQVPLHARLRRRGSGQRDFRRTLQSAPAQFHRPHDPPRRPGVLRILQSFMGYRTCYYRTFNVVRQRRHSMTPTERPANGSTRPSPASSPAPVRHIFARCSRRRTSSASPMKCRRSVCSLRTASASICTSGRSSRAWCRWIIRPRSRKAWCSRSRPIARPPTALRRAHRGRGCGHRQRLPPDLTVPGRGTAYQREVLSGAPSRRSSLRSFRLDRREPRREPFPQMGKRSLSSEP